MILRVLLALLLLVPIGVSAEVIPSIESPLELRVTPSNPAPNQTITVHAENVSGALGSTTFVWRINGQLFDQGLGRDTITTTLGEVNSVTAISVAVSQNGTLLNEKTIRIQPASLDIVWEGNTYTPVFYTGRPLPTGSSSLTLTAIPNINQNGSRVSSANLVYTWFINSSQTPTRSGFGTQTILLSPPQFETEFTVSVVAETADGSVRAQKQVTIKPVRPTVAIYEQAPLLGLRFDKAIMTETSLTEDEITLNAFPLFVNNVSTLNYEWFVGRDRVTETGKTDREVTLRRSGDGGGQFPIEFSFKSASLLFERASSNFLLTF